MWDLQRVQGYRNGRMPGLAFQPGSARSFPQSCLLWWSPFSPDQGGAPAPLLFQLSPHVRQTGGGRPGSGHLEDVPGGRCRGSCGLRLCLCLAHTFTGWFVGTSSPSILQTGRAWLQPPGLFLGVAQSGLTPSHCPAGLGLDLPTPLPHHGVHNWVLFLLWLHPFSLSGVISPLISSSILGTY